MDGASWSAFAAFVLAATLLLIAADYAESRRRRVTWTKPERSVYHRGWKGPEGTTRHTHHVHFHS